MTVLNASAICFHNDFGDGKLKHCWFGKFLMNESAYCQNMVVVHELIHSLEPNNYSNGSFCKDYWYLNEAMTEYFATRAQKYLGDNVMKNHGNEDTPYTCWYSKMLPLVEVLENSFYWNYFLDAKFNGNLGGLINIIGKRNLSIINKIFMDCINTESIDYEEREKLVKKLTELLDNMDKKKATSL